MFDRLLESSHRDDSNKWSNIGFGKEITHIESIEVYFTHVIWSSGFRLPVAAAVSKIQFNYKLIKSLLSQSTLGFFFQTSATNQPILPKMKSLIQHLNYW